MGYGHLQRPMMFDSLRIYHVSTTGLNALYILNSFLSMSVFCCLLIFANSQLDPDQDRQSISPDLDPNRLTL